MIANKDCRFDFSTEVRPVCCRIVMIVTLIGLDGDIVGAQGRSDRPSLIPLPAAVPAPIDQPVTPEKVELGSLLFFDPRLSGDNRMSCATCHVPEKSFSDGLRLGKGHADKSLRRNTQSLLNVGFYPLLFWDGRARSLEEQALAPIESADEMHQDLHALERELNAVPGYRSRFQSVFSTDVTRRGIAQALAAFQRTLVSRRSPFDRYLLGEKAALSDEALQGLELFQGAAGCVRCHHGPLLSDNKFHRIGIGLDDDGLGAVTGNREDKGKFRTPSLRNIAETGPYMHNGSRASLSEVVIHYYRGVPAAADDGLPLDIAPLSGQSFSEVSALVAFLESLTGEAVAIERPELP